MEVTMRMAAPAGVTEELKATNQMKWVVLINTVKSQAEESNLHELVYAWINCGHLC